MSGSLPEFAIALKRRMQARRSAPAPSVRPQLSLWPPLWRPNDWDEPSEDAVADEIYALRASNAQLQQRMEELEQQNELLQQQNREIIDEMVALRSESRRSAQAADAQRKIDELTQVLKSKDASIAAINQEYQTLEIDYQRLVDMRAADADSLRAKQLEVNLLQQELEQLRFSRRVGDEPPVRPPPKREFGLPLPAVRNSLGFEAEQPELDAWRDVPVADLTDGELRLRFDGLSQERQEKERKLNRAPPKGANLAHVRRQKEELDEDVVRLGSLIAKVRLEMKRRRIF
jgi:hypothetical protein